MVTNSAAWIDAPYAELVVRDSPYPVPGGGQVVIRVEAVAINPLDAIVQSNGKLMYGWLDYPVVLGEDVAGEVVEAGPGASRFALGDRVVGYAIGLEKGRNAVAEGGFQHYVILDEALAAPIPDEVQFSEAVVLPLAVSTAAAALFESSQLALDYSTLGASPSRSDFVIVWGGATSVGMNAIQLARAAGYRVITTASPRNHARMRELGAEAVFDYGASDVVASVVEKVAGSRVAGIVAIAVGSAEPSVAIAAATGARRVAQTSPSVSFYDQPRSGGLSRARAKLLARLIWTNVALQTRCAIRGIRARFVWGSAIAGGPVGAAIWTDYLPAAIARGQHILGPRPRVVGGSLEAVQEALNLMRTGVSAEKLVIELR
ncbi:zinc-binding alcohol dehydrogenase family protein [Leifsonia sp. RAF41]|uniref:zinc-binding alcohol dehydrogenase family protein n=1 Tax=Leifsonia sp. RAF41 TaxID=3233056 RepID=UPI003F9809A7